MTHRTLTTAIALALTLAATAGAQSTDRGNREERPRGAQQDSVGRRGPRGPEGMLLRGITLSAEQRTKLADLRQRERAEFGANRPRRDDGPKGQDRAARPRRERGDTTGMGARRAEMQKRFEQRIAAVRGILTADQRVLFDRNLAEMKAHAPQGRWGK